MRMSPNLQSFACETRANFPFKNLFLLLIIVLPTTKFTLASFYFKDIVNHPMDHSSQLSIQIPIPSFDSNLQAIFHHQRIISSKLENTGTLHWRLCLCSLSVPRHQQLAFSIFIDHILDVDAESNEGLCLTQSQQLAQEGKD